MSELLRRSARFSFSVERQEDIVTLLAFLTTSIVTTGLAATVRRKSEEELQHTRAELARFARVTILGELSRFHRA